MQDVNSYLARETLDDLTFLQQRADKLVEDQTTVEERLGHIRQMQDEISKLRLRKQELLAELNKEKTGPEALIPEDINVDEVDDNLRKLLLKRHLLEEQKAAYRLLGQTVSVVDSTTLRLCIDSCYEGIFSPPHYVDVRLDPSGPQIGNHTLPPFINLDSAREVLSTGMAEFLNYLQHNLQAFHIRKSFLVKVQEDFGDHLADEIHMTPSADWVRLTLKQVELCNGRPVTIQLKYPDISTWKAKAKITVHGEAEGEEEQAFISERQTLIRDVMTSTTLPEAIAAILMPPDGTTDLTHDDSGEEEVSEKEVRVDESEEEQREEVLEEEKREKELEEEMREEGSEEEMREEGSEEEMRGEETDES